MGLSSSPPRLDICTSDITSATLGGVGLNLVEASHLIITEPFWAPGREEQVTERAHRLPQKREVHFSTWIHKDLYGALIGKDDEAFDRELLSTRAAPGREEEVEVKVELLDLEDANDRIMKRINAN
ncbi:hypothetical protein DER46DRAFT_571185 [Fusarium sp. MPI-SDFR-AT-0072]|nr:hypothetical protein DER46DRAFT_571185 [Fusarium sp. MPI-SDFR-AT-0072]